MAWVSETGEYYAGDDLELLLLKESDLTPMQWENMSGMWDSGRLPYAKAILSGEDLSEWEGEGLE